MRLNILNDGYGPGTRLLFTLIRLFSGHPVPDAAKLVFYRPGFYGARMKEFTHEAMRGPSDWSVGDRELMAAFVSKVNESAFCIGALIEEPLRATLRMIGQLTREGRLGAEDVRAVLAAGVSPQQVEDALAVCFAFNVTGRLADAFGFEVLSREGFQAGAKYLLKRGYR